MDVRSPGEYQRGHIPRAYNSPLFDDNERAIIGTLYHKNGQTAAIKRGFDIAGSKIDGYLENASRVCGKKGKVVLYCWRGGMRSQSMALLLSMTGYEAIILSGGYKSYRSFAKKQFDVTKNIVILGGMTGSGKTDILRRMKSLGEQVVDLEDLAGHKGSVFGNLGLQKQCRTEHFENLLAEEWLNVSSSGRLWLEDESINIGHVAIPEPVFRQMQEARVILINVPFEERVARLTAEYGHFEKDVLKQLIAQIGRRLGSENAKKASECVDQGNISDSIAIVLTYYDKAYRYQLSKRPKEKITEINITKTDPEEIAYLLGGI